MGRTQRDRMLWVCVNGNRASELRRNKLGNQWCTAGSTDQQDPRNLFGGHTGTHERSTHGLDTVDERRSDQRLVLATSNPNISLQIRQQDGNRGVGISRKGFLGIDAVLTKPGHRRLGGRIVRIKLSEGPIK
jgi:hypothetical protein